MNLYRDSSEFLVSSQFLLIEKGQERWSVSTGKTEMASNRNIDVSKLETHKNIKEMREPLWKAIRDEGGQNTLRNSQRLYTYEHSRRNGQDSSSHLGTDDLSWSRAGPCFGKNRHKTG